MTIPGRVLIVIPTLNEIATIGPLLEQLLGEAAALGGHIVVADGGSVDGTIAVAKAYAQSHPAITVHPSAAVHDNDGRKWAGAGRNGGVEIERNAIGPRIFNGARKSGDRSRCNGSHE